MITDADLIRLRSQAEFNAMAFDTNTSQSSWRKLAEALKELEERREKEKEITGGR